MSCAGGGGSGADDPLDLSTPGVVLVVDDTPAALARVYELLTEAGITALLVTGGEEALLALDDEQPDLILLDVLMPDVDGFETCRRLKADPATRDIPVIFMTSLGDIEHRLEGFRLGAVDYVTKPFEEAELLARVRTQLSLRQRTRELVEKNSELEREIERRDAAEKALAQSVHDLRLRTEELRASNRRLAHEIVERERTDKERAAMAKLAYEMALSAEAARSARLEMERRALKKDLELAAAVQALFIPEDSGHLTDQMHLMGFYQPAAHCGGDWWSYRVDPEGRVRILLGDVTGHGPAAAMITAAIAGILQLDALRRTDVLSLLGQLHDSLLKLTGGRFGVSMCVIEADPRKHSVELTFAAWPPVFFLRADGATKMVTARSYPLGFDSLELKQSRQVWAPGDRLFAFSDGLPESRQSRSQRDFGFRLLQRILKKTRHAPLHEARRQIIEAWQTVLGDQDDDVMFVLLEHRRAQPE